MTLEHYKEVILKKDVLVISSFAYGNDTVSCRIACYNDYVLAEALIDSIAYEIVHKYLMYEDMNTVDIVLSSTKKIPGLNRKFERYMAPLYETRTEKEIIHILERIR